MARVLSPDLLRKIVERHKGHKLRIIRGTGYGVDCRGSGIEGIDPIIGIDIIDEGEIDRENEQAVTRHTPRHMRVSQD